MEDSKFPAPPRGGIVYGEIVHWMLLTGAIITVIGLVVYIMTPGYLDKSSLLNCLWQGDNCNTIWKEMLGLSQPPSWYSHLGMLVKGDIMATLGIAITCLAAVLGMWGVVFQMVRSRGRFYLVFALIIAVVLTLSALGLINLGD